MFECCDYDLGHAGISGRVSRDVAWQIDALIDEYMDLLEVCVRPHVKIQDNLGSKWLGKDVWTSKDPETTTIILQRRILKDPRTLERILAHEMVHHADFMSWEPEELVRAKMFGGGPGHGKSFMDLAAQINEVKGDDFVTERSDSSYVEEATREYHLLIVKLEDDPLRLGYAWGARLSPANKRCIHRALAMGGAYLKTTDPYWTRGAKIARCGSVSIPRHEADRDRLEELWERHR